MGMGDAVDDHRDLVDVAPRPSLPGLKRRSKRVLVRRRVPRRVTVRRRVTAAHLAAGQAHPQMHPPSAGRQAIRTSLRAARSDLSDLVQMTATAHHRRRLIPAPQTSLAQHDCIHSPSREPSRGDCCGAPKTQSPTPNRTSSPPSTPSILRCSPTASTSPNRRPRRLCRPTPRHRTRQRRKGPRTPSYGKRSQSAVERGAKDATESAKSPANQPNSRTRKRRSHD